MEQGRRTSWEGNWKVEITDTKMAVDMDKKKYVVGLFLHLEKPSSSSCNIVKG